MLATGVWATVAGAENLGSFEGNVVTKWNDDGRTMTLLEPFAYIDPTGARWDAPAGANIDGASIPRFAWAIIGGPFEGQYRNASVIHDVACVEKRRPWASVHQVFYRAMKASDVSAVKAKVMYAAVYHFGPRWPERQKLRQMTSPTLEQRKCFNIGAGKPMCVIIPQSSKSVEAVVTIEVPASDRTLSEGFRSPPGEDRSRRGVRNAGHAGGDSDLRVIERRADVRNTASVAAARRSPSA